MSEVRKVCGLCDSAAGVREHVRKDGSEIVICVLCDQVLWDERTDEKEKRP